MSIENKQLIQFINCSYELKEQLKENYYQAKIQEAKDKKGISQFKWNELPEEVEEKILEFKEIADIDYIQEVRSKYNLTMKSMEGYIFNEYKNEHDEGLSSVPSINYNFNTFMWIMINKKDWKEHYYPLSRGSRKYPQLIRNYNEVTKNKTPSLEEFIEFRKKEKEEESKARKAKNKNKPEIYTEFKVGDLVYQYDDEFCNNKHIFYITGETKTQFRVDKIELTDNATFNVENFRGHRVLYNIIYKNKENWKRCKHKNLGKKSNMYKLHNIQEDQTRLLEFATIEDYYITR